MCMNQIDWILLPYLIHPTPPTNATKQKRALRMATRRKVYEAYSKVGGEVAINEIGIPKARKGGRKGFVCLVVGMGCVGVWRVGWGQVDVGSPMRMWGLRYSVRCLNP